jgi:flavin reductase (DIM6/NTAB) family NADH-FMN oxidoreductase RutF
MKIWIISLTVSVLFFACQGKTQTENNNMDNNPTEEKANPTWEKHSWEALVFNTVELFGTDWALVATGNMEDYNMMTVSWGSWGWLWELPVANIYVRPQRHTHSYTEREAYFTICFFDDPDKEVLRKMGTVSGRDFDKMNYDKLTPFETENNSIAFEEAYLVVECRKIYADVLTEESFVDEAIASRVYPQKDFHTHYVGEITNVYVKE